jgi:hypothetical protein
MVAQFLLLLVLFCLCLPFWPTTTLRLTRYWWDGVRDAFARKG